MALDTAISERFQEQFEQAVRDVLGGISQSESGLSRELPPPRQGDQENFDLACAPELDAVSLLAVPEERLLAVSLYFDGVPGNGSAGGEPVPDAPGSAGGDSSLHLSDLGGGYADLSDAIVETLAAYCDAPADTRQDAFGEGEADLLCTGRRGSEVVFSLYVSYPAYVEWVYGEGRVDLAREYGLPY